MYAYQTHQALFLHPRHAPLTMAAPSVCTYLLFSRASDAGGGALFLGLTSACAVHRPESLLMQSHHGQVPSSEREGRLSKQ